MERKEEIYLGIDISTKTIGCCLLYNDESEHGKIIELTHVQPKISKKVSSDKNEILLLKVEVFKNEFLQKYKDIGIKKVFIEEPLVTSNNAETCATLLRFNGMISMACYQVLGVVPQYISSYEARKYSFPDLLSIRKYGKNGKPYENKKIISSIKKGNLVLFGAFPWDVEKKMVIQSKVAELFPDITWVYDKHNKLREENYDATDSYVALLGALNKERYGEMDMQVSNVVVTDKKVTFQVNYWDKKEERTVFLN